MKLITGIGAAPACPIGSNCDGGWEGGCGGVFGGIGRAGFGGFGPFGAGFAGGFGRAGFGCGGGLGTGWLGSVTEIPVHSIASFTHNAI